MSFKFKRARRRGAPQILGLVGGTGSGKTFSALLLAEGLAGGKRFAVIDTEAGKAQRYAAPEGRKPDPERGLFDFDHGDLKPPFTPAAYKEAIIAAEAAKYPVVVVDSFSHVWAGDGGVCDMHDAIVEEMTAKAEAKGWRPTPEKYNWPAWNKPKGEHKRMVARLLQLRCHLILCLRAEPKTKAIKVRKTGRNGKEYEANEVVDAGWLPICEKTLPFEFGTTFMLRNEKPGQITTEPVDPEDPTGYPMRLEEPLKEIFGGTFYLSRDHGVALARWAADGQPDPPDQELLKPKTIEALRKRFFSWAGKQPKGSGYPPTIAAMIERFGFSGGIEDMNVEQGKAFADFISATGKECRG